MFSRHRQEALCNTFFGRLTPGQSLVFFYTKSGHPLDETISRLVVGVGRVTSVSRLLLYESAESHTYPLWDRLFTHSIRPDGDEGFLLPYHDYLVPTGDPVEDERRRRLVREIAVVPEPSHIMSFSYAGELGTPDVALSALVRCLDVVRKVREHGIAKGPWERREEWLNAKDRRDLEESRSIPGNRSGSRGVGHAARARRWRWNSRRTDAIGELDDPWPILDAIFRGKEKPPRSVYVADIKAAAGIWTNLSGGTPVAAETAIAVQSEPRAGAPLV